MFGKLFGKKHEKPDTKSETQFVAKATLRRIHNCLLRCLTRWGTDHSRKYVEEAFSLCTDALRYIKDDPEHLRLSERLSETDKSVLWNRMMDWIIAENDWSQAQIDLEPGSPEYERIRRHQRRCYATIKKIIGLMDSPAK